jgi:glycosyltransferase involved in cell wall biosynthesis
MMSDLMPHRGLRISLMAVEERGNPYLILLAQSLRDLGHDVTFVQQCSPQWLWLNRSTTDVLHFHWVQYFYNSSRKEISTLWAIFFFFKLILAKMFGYRIVWTVHNLLPHERCPGPADHIARRSLILLADALVVHCRAAGTAVTRTFHRKRNIQVIPHGHYIHWYAGDLSREDARSLLHIPPEEYVYLYFGFIRPYKGVETLIETFKTLPSGYLVIAGRPCDAATEKAIRDRTERHARIRLSLGFIPDDQVQGLFACADAIVLPFTDVLTSGSAILALSMGKPVIVPESGCLPELVQDRLGILFDPRDPLGLAKALMSIPHRPYESAHITARVAELLDWQHIARMHETSYGWSGSSGAAGREAPPS